MRIHFTVLAAVACTLNSGAYAANDINQVNQLTQGEFRDLSSDLGAAVSYKAVNPALGLRGTYSKLSGVDQLELNTKGLELTISKGFAFFTPYAGVGHVWTESTPVNVSGLHAEKISDSKYYVGGNFNWLAGNLALEADRIGDVTSYSVKLGFRF